MGSHCVTSCPERVVNVDCAQMMFDASRHNPSLQSTSLEMMNVRLLVACRDGDVQGLLDALSTGAMLETRRPFVIGIQDERDFDVDVDSFGRCHCRPIGLTPLMHAAIGGHSQLCDMLLQKRADVEAEDEDGVRPLHLAAQSGSILTCTVMIHHGADRRAQDVDGRVAFDHVPLDEIRTQAEKKVWQALLCKSEPEVTMPLETKSPDGKFVAAAIAHNGPHHLGTIQL